MSSISSRQSHFWLTMNLGSFHPPRAGNNNTSSIFFRLSHKSQLNFKVHWSHWSLSVTMPSLNNVILKWNQVLQPRLNVNSRTSLVYFHTLLEYQYTVRFFSLYHMFHSRSRQGLVSDILLQCWESLLWEDRKDR